MKKNLLGRCRSIVSPMAGVSSMSLRQANTNRIRIMPNLASRFESSVTALCQGGNRDHKGTHHITRLLESCGTVITLREEHFALFTALFGSGPGFILTFLEARHTHIQNFGRDEKQKELH